MEIITVILSFFELKSGTGEVAYTPVYIFKNVIFNLFLWTVITDQRSHKVLLCKCLRYYKSYLDGFRP